MENNDELIEKRKKVYSDILFSLSSVLTDDEMYWLIWPKIANIVKGIESSCYQGDILGHSMSSLGWNHNLPYWCWDFLRFNEDKDCDNLRERSRYRELVANLKETGNYNSLGLVWQRVLKTNDKDTIIKVAEALEKLAYEFIPNTINDMIAWWSNDKTLKPEFFDRMKKLATTEKRRTLKLSRLLRSSVSVLPNP